MRRARPGDYIFTVTARRGIVPPWLAEYVINGRTRVKSFVLWRDAIHFALTEC